MISRLRVFAWFVLALGIWAGPMCGQEPENLLPGLQVTEGSGHHWEFVRNQEARVLGREETSEQGQPVLRLEASNAAGYGEWRVFPLTRVSPGTPYEARVMVSGHADAPPYIEVYSFNEAGVPRLIGRAAGSAGNLQDELLKCRFTVPPDGVKLRFGTGLSKAEGNLTISRAVLTDSVPGRPEPELTDAPRRPQAPPPQADWLWVQNDPGLPVLRFRKTFTLEETPASAIIQITADNAYKLQVNGRLVAEDSVWKSVEVCDVTSDLTKGENTIEIEVENYDDVGGALFNLRLRDATGEVRDISTDPTWKVLGKDGAELPLADLGAAPLAPWRSVSLVNVQPPQRVRGEIIRQTEKLMQGDVLAVELRLRDPEAAKSLHLEQLRVEVSSKGRPVAISGAELFSRLAGDRLTINLPVSRFAEPGEYNVRFTGNDFVIDAPLASLKIAAQPTPGFARSAATWPTAAGNRVETLGGVQSPFSYASILDANAARYQAWQTTGGHLYEIEAEASADYSAPGQWNIFPIERQILQILDADPFATVQLRVRVDMPSWWLEQHPEDRFRSNAGRSGKQSFASDAWRDEAARAIISLVQTLRSRPCGGSVGGVLLCAFRGGEFQLWGEDTGEYDISPVALAAFARWQEEAGVPQDQRISLPDDSLNLPFPKGEEAARSRAMFFRFLAERQADNIIAISRGIKAGLGENFPVTIYYGYVLEHAHSLKRLLFGGSLGFDRVMADPSVDAVSSPASYALRGPAGPHAFMYPVTSVRLHHKIPVLEDDVRNFRSLRESDSSGQRLHDLDSSILSLRKLRWLAASAGAYVRYLTAFTDQTDTLQDPRILVELRALNDTVMQLESEPVGGDDQVAFVVSTSDLFRAGELDETLVKTSVSLARKNLSQIGRPVALLSMQDWMANAGKWKTVILPLPGLLDESEKAALAAQFGELPDIALDSAFLLLAKGDKATVWNDAEKMTDSLKTPQAREQGGFWYFGTNFRARAGMTEGSLKMLPEASPKTH